jgi:hypothetical protein
LGSALNRIYNLVGGFHLIIIAMFLLSLSGCGYKDNPHYFDSEVKSDKSVKFFIKKPSGDNNESSR